MSREILFRGQTRRKGEKVWMDGRPVDSNWVFGGVLQGRGAFSIIYGSDNYNDIRVSNLDKHPVYTNTLGQYIGLTDKNGKKIFEGDIVNIEYPETTVENAVVEYIGASFYGSTYFDDWEFDDYCEIEVIGNIHDNPELLEAKA